MDSRSTHIQTLLRQRARERATALRWNTSSLILIYVNLTAVIILMLKEVDFSIVALVAIFGLASLWFLSWLQVKRLENKFYEEEVLSYAKLQSDEPLSKSDEADVSSLVSSMESPLTPRESNVLEQMAKGRTNKEIAYALQISEQTVKNHIVHIFWKLDTDDRTSAVLVAMRHGWIKGNHTE